MINGDDCQDVCVKFLKKQLDPINCLGIWAFADTYDCRDLVGIAAEFSKNNFQEVVKQEEFLLLPLAKFIDIISSDVLNVGSEEQVIQAVMTWIRHDAEERKSHLADLLRCVRLHLLNPEIIDQACNDDLIKSDDACGELVIRTKKILQLTQGERPQLAGRRLKLGHVLVIVGGLTRQGVNTNSMERYDPQTGEWRLMSPMSTRRRGHGVAVNNNLLYVVGGDEGQGVLNSTERYDPQTELWSMVAPMSVSRAGVWVAAMDGFLYATGGMDRDRHTLRLVERYDPLTNTWTEVAPMLTGRFRHALVALGSCLYSIGGQEEGGVGVLNSVEQYNPRDNTWTEMASLVTRRVALGAAVLNDKIYVAGGSDGLESLSSVEVYDPSTDTWSPGDDMMSRRFGFGLAVIQGKLAAVGGCSNQPLETIEMYDEDTATWVPGPSMSIPRVGGSLGVVKMLC